MSKNNNISKRNKPKILTKYDQFVATRLRDIPVWVRDSETTKYSYLDIR